MEWSEVLPAATTLTKEDYLKILHEGKTVVTFKKVDGTTRTMPCTLNPALLPKMNITDEDLIASPIKTRTSNPNVCVVYDLDKQAWRSFRWDSIILFDPVMVKS